MLSRNTLQQISSVPLPNVMAHTPSADASIDSNNPAVDQDREAFSATSAAFPSSSLDSTPLSPSSEVMQLDALSQWGLPLSPSQLSTQSQAEVLFFSNTFELEAAVPPTNASLPQLPPPTTPPLSAPAKKRSGPKAKNPAEKEVKTRERVLRNRAAAQISRDNKRKYVAEMESSNEELQEENCQLLKRLKMVENENLSLTQRLELLAVQFAQMQHRLLSQSPNGSAASSPQPIQSSPSATSSPLTSAFPFIPPSPSPLIVSSPSPLLQGFKIYTPTRAGFCQSAVLAKKDRKVPIPPRINTHLTNSPQQKLALTHPDPLFKNRPRTHPQPPPKKTFPPKTAMVQRTPRLTTQKEEISCRSMLCRQHPHLGYRRGYDSNSHQTLTLSSIPSSTQRILLTPAKARLTAVLAFRMLRHQLLILGFIARKILSELIRTFLTLFWTWTGP